MVNIYEIVLNIFKFKGNENQTYKEANMLTIKSRDNQEWEAVEKGSAYILLMEMYDSMGLIKHMGILKNSKESDLGFSIPTS